MPVIAVGLHQAQYRACEWAGVPPRPVV